MNKLELFVFTALRLPSGNLPSECVQALLPKSAKLVNPGIDLLKRIRVNRIDSSWPVDANSDEAALAQCSEMLRNARLGDAELFLDHVRDTSGAAVRHGRGVPESGGAQDPREHQKHAWQVDALQFWPV